MNTEMEYVMPLYLQFPRNISEMHYEPHVQYIASLPDPVKYLRSSVSLHIIASCHHDQADSKEHRHHRKALGPAPDIKDLGEWQLEDAADQIRHELGGGCERMLLETAREVRQQGVGHALLHCIDEANDPDSTQWMIRTVMSASCALRQVLGATNMI